MDKISFHLYGERGVVNAMLQDIYQGRGNHQQKLNAFFRAISLQNNQALPWAAGVRDCQWLIEPSFAQFGNPDFIASFWSGDKKYALFFEAKLKSCQFSSLEIREDMDQSSYKGQSSKLNVQLALRYRFVQAYLNNPQGSITERELTRGEKPLDGVLRKLDKSIVLETARSFFKDVSDFYYIALTNDKASTKAKDIDNSFLPPLPKADRSRMHEHFGLLTYSSLQSAGAVHYQKGHFGVACRMMGLIRPDDVKCIQGGNLQPKPLVETIDESVVKAFRDQEGLSFVAMPGSLSARAMNKVVMKLISDPRRPDKLMLGLREISHVNLELEKDIDPEPIEYFINGIPFIFYSFGLNQKEQVIKLAQEYMASFKQE